MNAEGFVRSCQIDYRKRKKEDKKKRANTRKILYRRRSSMHCQPLIGRRSRNVEPRVTVEAPTRRSNLIHRAKNLILQNILYSLNFTQHIRDIKDPEHPYSLEELKVVSEDAIEVDDEKSHVRVTFTPTVEHCSMATVIGLCLQVKLMRSLPPRYKVDIRVAPGTHATEAAVNKQLNDKERVAAALENPNLLNMVDECLAPSYE
ncbi:MIP18 family protein At1g68310 [Striga asiatica]|uniref:MIP18 family protein At1g68310 n=2 Tax=Striga TaxID=4169 RepID=A0A5A7P237_STRAF|nr:MIP18 family protein At1g68310 [Striga asiatica]